MKILPAKLLAKTDRVVSMSEGRRVVIQGAVRLNDEIIKDITKEVDVEIGDILRVGKRNQVVITEELLENLSEPQTQEVQTKCAMHDVH